MSVRIQAEYPGNFKFRVGLLFVGRASAQSAGCSVKTERVEQINRVFDAGAGDERNARGEGVGEFGDAAGVSQPLLDRKSTRLNSSHT